METDLISLSALLAVFLALSAFFSGSETALFSLSRWRVQDMLRRGLPGAARVERLRARPRRLLTTILVGNNLVNLGATAFVESRLHDQLGPTAVPISIAVMTLTLLLAGEIVPKSLAARRAEQVARLVAAPIEVVGVLVAPLRGLIRLASAGVLWLLGVRGEMPAGGVSRAELRAAFRQSEVEGLVREREGEILEGVLGLKETTAAEVMVPRTRIVSLPAGATPAQALELLRRTHHSRIPVYRGDREQIEGVLFAKDLLKLPADPAGRPAEVAELARPAVFVPESKKAHDLLREMRARSTHMVLVVDEHGGLAGLVTLEDLLEEVVGELADELDVPERHFVRRAGGAIEVLGATPVERFEERFGPVLPPGEAQTVGGRVMEQLGRLPEEGEAIEAGQMRLVVTRVLGARVARLLVARQA